MKKIRAWLALLLTALMVLASPLQSVALAEVSGRTGKYLSEAYVSVAPTAAEAARKLEEKGYTVLKKDGKPADLNQGAGSALKESRAVVLGYKTTDDSAAAITDLAAMNMNGGYSVSSYRDLVRKYRDSTISPFVQRFMTTISEYRENLASKNAGNRAKAEFMRSLLNRVVDDDTGGESRAGRRNEPGLGRDGNPERGRIHAFGRHFRAAAGHPCEAEEQKRCFCDTMFHIPHNFWLDYCHPWIWCHFGFLFRDPCGMGHRRMLGFFCRIVAKVWPAISEFGS